MLAIGSKSWSIFSTEHNSIIGHATGTAHVFILTHSLACNSLVFARKVKLTLVSVSCSSLRMTSSRDEECVLHVLRFPSVPMGLERGPPGAPSASPPRPSPPARSLLTMRLPGGGGGAHAPVCAGAAACGLLPASLRYAYGFLRRLGRGWGGGWSGGRPPTVGAAFLLGCWSILGLPVVMMGGEKANPKLMAESPLFRRMGSCSAGQGKWPHPTSSRKP